MGVIDHSNSVYVDLNVLDINNYCRYLAYIIMRTPLRELKFRVFTLINDTSCISSIINSLENDARFSGYANVTKLVIRNEFPSMSSNELSSLDYNHLKLIIEFMSICQKNLQFVELFCVIDQIDSFYY